MRPSSHLDTLSTYPISSKKRNFASKVTRPELAKVLSEEKSDTMSVNKQWGLVIKEQSKYIPMSVTSYDGETVIDSVVELDPNLTNTIATLLKKEISWLTTNDTATKEYQTLDHLQQILQQELGTITDISSAESEQSNAIHNSETGIIKSTQLSQKMCTLRAGYTAQVLKQLWRKVTTLCGHMDGEWHARNILKSPSGQKLMYDPMNPSIEQWRPFVNMLKIDSEYEQIKNGTYRWLIKMNGHNYNMGMEMKRSNNSN